MRLINTTDYPDYFLRRLVSWCCKEIGYPVRSIRRIRFARRNDGRTSGRAWWPSNRIHVSAGGTLADWKRTQTCWGFFGEADPTAQERRRVNSLVHIVAHEIIHLWLHKEEGKRSAQEPKTEWHANKVRDKFLANREALLTAWRQPPTSRPAKPKPSLQEKRAEATRKKLVEWTRKQKLATTKVKQYKAKVRYYDRAMAAKRAM